MPTNKEQMIEEAAQWHVTMTSDEVKQEELVEFREWLKIPEHAEVYQRFDHLWKRFEPVSNTVARSTINQVVKHPARISKTAIPILLVGIVSSLLIAQPETSQLIMADHTAFRQPSQIITLPDQSQIVLDPMSAVDINYSQDSRDIHLHSGKVTIEVARDLLRPLQVITEYGTARALGTQFSVEISKHGAQVNVIESRVEVCAKKEKACEQLTAGEMNSVTADQVTKPRPINKGFMLDLFNQQLVVDNQSIVKVLDTLKPYYKGYLSFDRESLGNIKVSGVFPLDNPLLSLQTLENAVAVKATNYSRWITHISLRKAQDKKHNK